MYPLMTLIQLTLHLTALRQNETHIGIWNVVLSSLCALRLARTGYSQPQLLYAPLIFTALMEASGFVDYARQSNFTPLIIVYLLAGIWPKLLEFMLKLEFIVIYSVRSSSTRIFSKKKIHTLIFRLLGRLAGVRLSTRLCSRLPSPTPD